MKADRGPLVKNSTCTLGLWKSHDHHAALVGHAFLMASLLICWLSMDSGEGRQGRGEEHQELGKCQHFHAQGSRQSNILNLPRRVSRETWLRMPDSKVGEGHTGC